MQLYSDVNDADVVDPDDADIEYTIPAKGYPPDVLVSDKLSPKQAKYELSSV